MQSIHSPFPDIHTAIQGNNYPGRENLAAITNEHVAPLIEGRADFTPTSVARPMGDVVLKKCGIYSSEIISSNELRGPELLLAEWVHAGFIFPGDQTAMSFCQQELGLPVQRIDEIIGMVERDIAAEVDHIYDAVEAIYADIDGLGRDISDHLQTDITKNTPKLLTAALIVADAAHGDDARDAGGRVFHEHILEAAQAAQYAWNKAKEELGYEPDQKYLILQLVHILMHDAWEDVIKKDGGSPLRGDNFHPSPRFMNRMLRQFGVSIEDATELCNDLNYVTKFRSPDGKTFAPDVYDARRMATIRATIGKGCDNASNTIHPKPIDETTSDERRQKIISTQNEYDVSFDKLANALPHTFNDEFGHVMMQYIGDLRQSPEDFLANKRQIVLGVSSSRRGALHVVDGVGAHPPLEPSPIAA